MDACSYEQALFCYQCVCVTWKSLIGLGMPLIALVVYLPRLLSEVTADDVLICGTAAFITLAFYEVSPEGLRHTPWMFVFVALWAITACETDRVGALRSLPLVWAMTFVSIAIADVVNVGLHAPEGKVGIPGGGGLVDGLVVKPLLAAGVIWLAYVLKAHPILPKRQRRGKTYDKASSAYLFNVSPRYRRPAWDGTLKLIDKGERVNEDGATQRA